MICDNILILIFRFFVLIWSIMQDTGYFVMWWRRRRDTRRCWSRNTRHLSQQSSIYILPHYHILLCSAAAAVRQDDTQLQGDCCTTAAVPAGCWLLAAESWHVGRGGRKKLSISSVWCHVLWSSFTSCQIYDWYYYTTVCIPWLDHTDLKEAWRYGWLLFMIWICMIRKNVHTLMTSTVCICV